MESVGPGPRDRHRAAPPVDLGSMAWIKVLWTWLVPPPRAYKIDGALLGNQPGAYRLMIRRTDLSTNSVDASRTFETTVGVAEVAFQGMAELAAKWLCYPRDIEASAAVARGIRAADAGGADATPSSASEIYDAALDLLLPVRQQINQGAIDYADRARTTPPGRWSAPGFAGWQPPLYRSEGRDRRFEPLGAKRLTVGS